MDLRKTNGFEKTNGSKKNEWILGARRTQAPSAVYSTVDPMESSSRALTKASCGSFQYEIALGGGWYQPFNIACISTLGC